MIIIGKMSHFYIGDGNSSFGIFKCNRNVKVHVDIFLETKDHLFLFSHANLHFHLLWHASHFTTTIWFT